MNPFFVFLILILFVLAVLTVTHILRDHLDAQREAILRTTRQELLSVNQMLSARVQRLEAVASRLDVPSSSPDLTPVEETAPDNSDEGESISDEECPHGGCVLCEDDDCDDDCDYEEELESEEESYETRLVSLEDRVCELESSASAELMDSIEADLQELHVRMKKLEKTAKKKAAKKKK